jgi:hypothetical protein
LSNLTRSVSRLLLREEEGDLSGDKGYQTPELLTEELYVEEYNSLSPEHSQLDEQESISYQTEETNKPRPYSHAWRHAQDNKIIDLGPFRPTNPNYNP